MKQELKNKLAFLADKYEVAEFIMDDPIQFPHRYTSKADIEISALVVSWIATGNRKAIIKSGDRIDRELFSNAPYRYILNEEWKKYRGVKTSFYRYYSWNDFYLLCQALYAAYQEHEDLEVHLCHSLSSGTPLERLQSVFGHINGMPALASASEAKKMCMFLRWMIRRDSPVDLGIWRSFDPSDLIIPLDTHVHRISVDLGLTHARKCLKTACCITDALREVWPDDPVKGDFALFGFGINESVRS
ncbi:TIGR02757 family protein [Bacteroides hominis]|uniref:TIGR02757 family protein n=3 Tax=Bacteroides TaxID=816 RepID=A0AAP9N9L9_BACFG|nr:MULTISPECIES: TIGR02757 family protein [Bacteroides]AUI46669.1 TIGR02757 family protein [Bacteroides fragilis]EFR53311.1 TIGR02757 family protein [Bacteroides fragilis 3_1_12]MBM6511624.1 TIGR02757 family protein [Bacteroides fragilis]MCC2233669.1 TIGR02757 family protein [Bacteroides hominis (ex Afrizal et al. 2022)]MCE8558260.1 TIGR02757 family protein [Bacteroides fragilis]